MHHTIIAYYLFPLIQNHSHWNKTETQHKQYLIFTIEILFRTGCRIESRYRYVQWARSRDWKLSDDETSKYRLSIVVGDKFFDHADVHSKVHPQHQHPTNQ